MRRSFLIFAIGSLFLTACGSNPQSYLTAKSKPIVNIQAPAEQWVEVSAKSDALTFSNKTEMPVNVVYKLFWYDKNGVTQVAQYAAEQDSQGWQTVQLLAKTTQQIALLKPTDESENYRVYLRVK